MTTQQFQIGRGASVEVYRLGGTRVPPTAQTLTVSNAGSPVLAPATTIPVTALAADLEASAELPLYVSFTNTDGSEVLVEVTAAAAAGDTSLTCTATPGDIDDGATAPIPARLLARTAANVNTNSNNVTTTTFDTGGWEDGIVSMNGMTFSCPGNFLQTDAGWRQCYKGWTEFKNLYLIVTLPAPAGYTTGYKFAAPCDVTSANIEIPADGIITSPLEFTVRGEPTITDPS